MLVIGNTYTMAQQPGSRHYALTERTALVQGCSVDGGRASSVAVGRLQTQLEYSQLPAEQLSAVVLCLLGALHIR